MGPPTPHSSSSPGPLSSGGGWGLGVVRRVGFETLFPAAAAPHPPPRSPAGPSSSAGVANPSQFYRAPSRPSAEAAAEPPWPGPEPAEIRSVSAPGEPGGGAGEPPARVRVGRRWLWWGPFLRECFPSLRRPAGRLPPRPRGPRPSGVYKRSRITKAGRFPRPARPGEERGVRPPPWLSQRNGGREREGLGTSVSRAGDGSKGGKWAVVRGGGLAVGGRG